MRTEEEVRAANKKLFKRIGIGILVLIAFFILVGALGGSKDNASSTNTDHKSQKTQANIATRVDTSLKKELGVKNYTDSVGDFMYINGIKDDGGGDVDVALQEDCDKQTASSTSRQIMQLVGGDVKDLQIVFVKCLNGTYQYTSRDMVFTGE